MPREPIPLVRKGGFVDAEKMFVLSYEGSVSEKKYFEDFRRSALFKNSGFIEIISLKRPSGRGSDPISVKKLLHEAKKEYRFKETDEFWLIIDRDDWEVIHHYNFDQLVADCKKENNFFLAMSNPCFEIWLLLHLKDINDFDENEKQRILVNEKVSGSKKYIDKVLSEIQGRGYNKRPNPEVFHPSTRIAFDRARELDKKNEPYPKHLGTHIYKLMEKLLAEL
jgi:hypothetical protein